MSKEKNAKKIRIIAMIVIGLVVIGVVCFILLRKKEEAYRNIRVVEVVGEATVWREEIKDLKVYENMNLQSGDVVFTGEKSKVTLRLDDDKYVVIDENSKLTLQAEGTAEDSKTSITLEYGAMFSDLQSKLSENSDFTVVAPCTVISVRGTQFEVVYRELRDEAGNIIDKVMKVLTFEGSVSIKPTGSSEKRISKAGTMEVFKENQDGTYGFAAETKQIEAEDISDLSASYLKGELFPSDSPETEVDNPIEKEEPAEKEETQEPADSGETELFYIKYYSLSFMDDPATLAVTEKEGFFRELVTYELSSQRCGMVAVEWNREVAFAESIARLIEQDEQMKRSAEAIFDEPVEINCYGFFDEYLNSYNIYDAVTMSEVSTTVKAGDTMNLYPIYYVEGLNTGMKASYVPCIMSVREDGTNTSYAMMLKAGQKIGLPELTDCTLAWTGGSVDGKRTVSGSGVNRLGVMITE